MQFIRNLNGADGIIPALRDKSNAIGLVLTAFVVSSCGTSDINPGAYVDASDIPVSEQPERVYWGDLHLHTLYFRQLYSG